MIAGFVIGGALSLISFAAAVPVVRDLRRIFASTRLREWQAQELVPLSVLTLEATPSTDTAL